jgi:uncharacterized repeat protein (TIGR01451 family)
MTGTGVAPVATVTPSSLAFGTVDIGATAAAKHVTVSNNSTDAGQVLTINALSITGAGAGDFTYSPVSCSLPANVNPFNGSCSFDVALSPSATGTRAALLMIETNDPVTPELAVVLSGSGASPSADLAAQMTAVQKVIKGKRTVTYTISVTNGGPATATTVQVDDALPSQVAFVSATASHGTCATPTSGTSGVVMCGLGSITNGATASVQIVVAMTARRTSVVNSATVSATTVDPYATNNTTSISVTVR